MLIIKVMINERTIKEICIHNRGEIDKANRHLYNVYMNCDPLTKLDRVFHHHRDMGWEPLVIQVLKHMLSLKGIK